MATAKYHQFANQINDLNDLTECPICTEILSDPKFVNCHHTFCKKCLEQICAGQRPGSIIPCPLCRSEFTIPVGGVSKLKTNFYVEKLIEAGSCLKKMSSSKSDKCICESGHDIAVYCRDCNMAVCFKCKMKSHQNHYSTDFAIHLKQLRQQIIDDHNRIGNLKSKMSLKTIEFDEEFSKMVNNFKETRDQIEAKTSDLKCRIDRQAMSLLTELESLESAQLKKADILKQNQETIKKKFPIFLQNCERLWGNDNCGPNGLIQLADDLHRQAEELVDQSFECSQIGAFSKVSFTESKMNDAVGEISVTEIKNHALQEENIKTKNQNDCKNIVQESPLPWSSASVQICNIPRGVFVPAPPPPKFKSSPLQKHSLNAQILLEADFNEEHELEGSVSGMFILGRQLYVIYRYSIYVDVFNSYCMTHEKRIDVPDLCNPYDITGYGSLLFISESDRQEIHKFRLAQRTTSTWSVGGCQMSLSMTSQQNILATCCEKDQGFISEYSRIGELIRKIILQKDIINPRHAICLNNGNLIVCHGLYGDRMRRVCSIDSDGEVIMSFGGFWSSGSGALNEPARLAFHRAGFILVSDVRNNNVQILNEDLEFVQEIISNSERVEPKHMCMDEKSRKFFIGCSYNSKNKIKSYMIEIKHYSS